MINFDLLEVRINNNYSFVGIERKAGEVSLHLPKGFSQNDIHLLDFNSKKKIFFQLYKTIREFRRICLQKGYIDESSDMVIADRDGLIDDALGSKLEPKEADDIILYSKIDVIERLIDACDEFKILALKYRLGKSQKFNVGQIHKYLHQAIYLPNNAAYVDEALIARPVLKLDSTDIVSMYCYLYCEVKEQLEESVTSEIRALAEEFRQHHLGAKDSIFDENTYDRTLDALKNLLDTIDKTTSIKDDDYWQYYEAIELFLYGEWSNFQDGRIWGISNFHSVWESICLTHLVKKHTPKSLLYVDTQYVDNEILLSLGFSDKAINRNGQIFKINGSQLVPDAVVSVSIDSQIRENSFQRSYHISSNTGWNDYGFFTLFDFTRSKQTYIGYIGQDSGNHTVYELEEIYSNYTGQIDRALDKKFYSFWYIEPEDTIDSKYLHKMYCFNHLFYIALREGATDWISFKEKILTPLSVKFGLRYNSPEGNVFTHSLLRGYCVEGTEGNLRRDFELAIKKMVNIYDNFLEVVDVKYLTDSYFSDANNAELIKTRSVRKQFVYEYLLQKQLERSEEPGKTIKSSFWLPKSQNSEGGLIELGSDFMDGYIQLKNIDFMSG